MSLIKRSSGAAAGATAYRGHASGRTPLHAVLPAAEAESAEDRHTAQLDRLRDQLAALASERDAAAEAAVAECAAAFERGRAQGLENAETREAERLAALGEAIETALSRFDARLTSERDLAIDIAQAALKRVLGDPARYGELVAETARHHAAAVLRGTLLQVQVSAVDFPDEAVLQTLPQFGQAVTVAADPALAPGSCRFGLSLGALDASIPRQAAALGEVLERARQGEVEPA